MDLVDKLYNNLKKLDLDDSAILSGIKISDNGLQKLADNFGIEISDVKLLFAKLITRLRDEQNRMDEIYINEDYRFSYEKDFLGNVTVRDGITGKEKFLIGSKATNLLIQLTNSEEKNQNILSKYITESVYENNNDDDDDYDEEINSKVGTFNFPWKYNSKNGFGVASYKAISPRKMKIKILYVTDKDGNKIDFSSFENEIEDQAKKIIFKL